MCGNWKAGLRRPLEFDLLLLRMPQLFTMLAVTRSFAVYIILNKKKKGQQKERVHAHIHLRFASKL